MVEINIINVEFLNINIEGRCGESTVPCVSISGYSKGCFTIRHVTNIWCFKGIHKIMLIEL